MQASVLRLALLGAAAVLAGCASGVPTNVEWERQSMIDQHRYMPTLTWDPTPTVVVNAGPTGAVSFAGAPPQAAQAVVVGESVRLVTQEEFARLQRENPQVLGAPPAPSAGMPAPAATPSR